MSRQTEPVTTLARPGLLLALLAGGAFGVAMDSSQFVPILADVATDLRTTPPEVGQVLGLGALVSTLVVLVAGPLSDRYGRRPMLVGGAGLLALASVATSLAPDYPAFLLARLCAAVGASLLMPATFAAVADFLPDRQASGVGVLTGVTGLPYLAGWPLAGLATEMIGWRVVPVALALVFVVLAAGYTLTVPSRRLRPAGAATSAALLGVLRHYVDLLASGQVRLGLAVSAAAAASWFGILVYVGTYLRETYDLGPAGVTLPLMLLGAGYVGGGALTGRAVALWSSRGAVIRAFSVLGVLLAILMMAPGPLSLAAVLLTVIGIVRAIGLSSFTSLYLDLTHSARGTGQALNSAVFTLGISLGASGGGLLVASAGYPALGLATGALALVAALGAARLHRPAPA